MTIRRVGLAWCVAAALALAIPAGASAQAKTKPKNATGECKDGTYTTAKNKKGACSAHGGVVTWYDEAAKDTKAAAKEATKETKAAAKETEKGTKAAAKEVTKDTKAAGKEVAKETKAAKDAVTASPRPPDAPPDATAQCNDGTYSTAKHHSGACSHHKGVKTWYK